MKTRLLWLGLLCLAFLFALGLLVVSAEALPMPTPRPQYFLSALPASDSAGQTADSAVCRPVCLSRRVCLQVPCPMFRRLLESDANGTPVTGGSYADAAFAAFHFSDEAG